ncbi:hypothetical protein KYN89_00855 [Alteriqipengyuania sp. NZ-12B]|uniref:Uncharacterized protein n=1 Tax=Alteriqipengyuania abyssalis TaxID=2860200 RepID=A0ABS7P937_9SPHN|nr:hypothetical protein [Alteriqipengyuania abyssalis]MBY8335585.1 hypothetical protein [Alteriqipengyuania abyssalis]
MKTDVAVFVTDGVNRQNMLLPLATLVESMETPLAAAIASNIPYGMPANLAHDLCRPVGWSEPRGIYLSRDMARQLGRVFLPETEEDHERIGALIQGFANWSQARQIEPFADGIKARVANHATSAMRLWHGEAAGAIEPGLASAMFPEFFALGSEHVDKDGLVNFNYLRERTREVQPGVFHEPERDILLFAHRYFRRSLSLRNSLNAYVLRSFSDAAALEGMTARLRLDPDVIGLPESSHSRIELEYWHGPKYDDDIASIPAGVAEHKSNDGDRHYSRIDKTQIWWKDPETRSTPGLLSEIRTFEIEELIDDESPGLPDGMYGCRYAHAEYDLAKSDLAHFDGAIRAYPSEAYLERIERRIDRAGKHSDYTKLFRLDGALPVSMWKRVLTDWYRGNRLIPEYLGAPEEDLAEAYTPPGRHKQRSLPALGAFLCLEKASPLSTVQTQVVADQTIELDGRPVQVAEVAQGEVGALMRQWVDSSTSWIAARSTRANLARILLPGDPPSETEWIAVAEPLARAISDDLDTGLLERIALSISWRAEGVLTTLSIEGEAGCVSLLLADAVTIVRPDMPASSWIEAFRDALVDRAPELDAPVDWPANAARCSRLTLLRNEDLKFDIQLRADQNDTQIGHEVDTPD